VGREGGGEALGKTRGITLVPLGGNRGEGPRLSQEGKEKDLQRSQRGVISGQRKTMEPTESRT